ncbi:MAG: hypothetical protein RIC35_14445 [Marinoscillum sp.]
MYQSPLVDSSIIFISQNVETTQKLLRLIRKKELSRDVFWFRSLEQVSRHFEKIDLTEGLSPRMNLSVVLDYDLVGISHITHYLNDYGILKYCDLYSLKAVSTEVNQMERLLQE